MYKLQEYGIDPADDNAKTCYAEICTVRNFLHSRHSPYEPPSNLSFSIQLVK